MLAPWIGGAASPVDTPPAGDGGYRSLLAFWIGGAANNGEAPTEEPSDGLLGGGGYYHGYYDKHASLSYREKRDYLQELIDEISASEQKEKPLTKKAKRNTEAEIKLLALRDEISMLRLERNMLLRMIDDEEAIFILLASTPFH